MPTARNLLLAAGSTPILAAALAPAQCQQPWFEPRVLHRARPIAVVDADGTGLLEIVASDADGLAVWTFDAGPAPARTPIFDGPIDRALRADLDGDGDTDIAAITDGGQTIRVFLHEAGVWTQTSPVSIDAVAVAAIDHLTDGDTDLFVIDTAGDGHILANAGDGSLTDLGVFITGDLQRATTGRFDADPRDDLFVFFGNQPEDAAVYLQQPGGAFAQGPAPGDRPDYLVDINADGLDDMLINTGVALQQRLALGDGAFGPGATLIDSPVYPDLVDDFDGDGDPDMLVTIDNDRPIYRNRGDNTFEIVNARHIPLYLPDPPFLADIDGNGAPDLVTSLRVGATFLRGNGDCSFTSPPSIPLGDAYAARRMTLGDLDTDGDTDAVVLVTDPIVGAVAICLNNGLGQFSVARTEPGAGGAVGYEPPALADLDADGDLDIAFWVNGLIVLLENTPDHLFSTRREIPAGQTYLGAPLLCADVDGNGLPDLLYPPAVIGEHATLLVNHGAWSFSSQSLDTDPYPVTRALLDITGDGVPDLLATNDDLTGAELGLLPGNGDGSFAAPIPSDLINRLDAFFFPGDFNGDNHTDFLAVPYVGPDISLLIGDGSGGFTDLGEVRSYGDPRGIGVADLNADGLDDFIAGGQRTSYTGIHLSNGDGTFTDPIVLPVDSMLTAAPAQLNGQGGTDILIAHNLSTNAGGTLTTLINQCGPYACPADLNRDGRINSLDFIRFLSLWSAGVPLADWDHNGTVNTQDFLAYLGAWSIGCYP